MGVSKAIRADLLLLLLSKSELETLLAQVLILGLITTLSQLGETLRRGGLWAIWQIGQGLKAAGKLLIVLLDVVYLPVDTILEIIELLVQVCNGLQIKLLNDKLTFLRRLTKSLAWLCLAGELCLGVSSLYFVASFTKWLPLKGSWFSKALWTALPPLDLKGAYSYSFLSRDVFGSSSTWPQWECLWQLLKDSPTVSRNRLEVELKRLDFPSALIGLLIVLVRRNLSDLVFSP